ncbi:hypothetical protein J3R83DRAFT_13273 [Lanmaoa asiatica]|nr:hypothetical protein J3R83DRAFT_13273 [Lanmaoa asiatica]
MILEGLLSMKHITTYDMMRVEDLQRADRKDGLVELGVVDEEVSYLQQALGQHPLFSKDGESSDSRQQP